MRRAQPWDFPRLKTQGRKGGQPGRVGGEAPRLCLPPLWKAFLEGWQEPNRMLPAWRRPPQSPTPAPGPPGASSPTLPCSPLKFLFPRHYGLVVPRSELDTNRPTLCVFFCDSLLSQAVTDTLVFVLHRNKIIYCFCYVIKIYSRSFSLLKSIPV